MISMGSYSVKSSGLICKSLIFAPDDEQKIAVKFCDNSSCYLITDEKTGKQEVLEENDGCIYGDNMN